MPTGTLQVVQTYSVIQCDHEGCGVQFALNDDYIIARKRDRRTWFCPNGHSRWYPGKTEAQTAREEAEAERARAERLAAQLTRRGEDLARERRQHSATKGQLTKTKKRVTNGVCPYCNRSFSALTRHMKSQHADCLAAL